MDESATQTIASPGEAPTFVARTASLWFELGAGRAEAVDVERVLDLLRVSARACVVAAGTFVDQFAEVADFDDVFDPTWMWIGRVADGALEVSRADGRLVRLDSVDVRILDSVEPATVAADIVRHLATASVPSDERLVLLRLGQLRSSRRLLVDHTSSGTPIPPDGRPSESTECADERSTTPLVTGIADEGAPRAEDIAGRVSVHSIWQTDFSPPLSIGMLLAHARGYAGGALDRAYDLRPIVTADEALADIAGRDGPIVLLCSNYVWSIEVNLAWARAAAAVAADRMVVIHGGPSTPAEEAAAEAFLREHADVAHILVRGEGELALAEVLAALHAAGTWDLSVLGGVAGLCYLEPSSGRFVRTADRDRISELDALPSPFLSGEFDHLPVNAWRTEGTTIETTRGCPYGCTFCDWGSATLSRIRQFSVERVSEEIAWIARRGIRLVFLADANFGILARDVDVARAVAEHSARYDGFSSFIFSPAKNTTKYLAQIVDVLIEGGVEFNAGLGIQSVDEATLDAVHRRNISSAGFVRLAAELRRRGLKPIIDLILGLPGQTVESVKADIQFVMDHECWPRVFYSILLPNSPMNAPEYRREWEIQTGTTDSEGIVVATSTFTEAERDRMIRLHHAAAILDGFGLLRHVLRFLQWDYGLRPIDVIDDLLEELDASAAMPVTSAVLEHFRAFPVAPVGWGPFYEEIASWVGRRYAIERPGGLDVVLRVQEAVMPDPGRRFPDTVELAHDYVEYYLSATVSLFDTGVPGIPSERLIDLPATTLTVAADPLHLCSHGADLRPTVADAESLAREPQRHHLAHSASFELESPLMRLMSSAIKGIERDRFASAVLSLHTERIRERGAGDEHGVGSFTDQMVRHESLAVPVRLTRRASPA